MNRPKKYKISSRWIYYPSDAERYFEHLEKQVKELEKERSKYPSRKAELYVVWSSNFSTEYDFEDWIFNFYLAEKDKELLNLQTKVQDLEKATQDKQAQALEKQVKELEKFVKKIDAISNRTYDENREIIKWAKELLNKEDE